jgi:hypothetical protein
VIDSQLMIGVGDWKLMIDEIESWWLMRLKVDDWWDWKLMIDEIESWWSMRLKVDDRWDWKLMIDEIESWWSMRLKVDNRIDTALKMRQFALNSAIWLKCIKQRYIYSTE